MVRILPVLISILFTFSACSSQNKKPLVIATNQWIGYAPLFYAYEKGELDKLNIQLINRVSLAEAANLYSIGKADMVTTTQHECNYLKKSTHDITAVILIDRSNGGDMILSNRSLQQLSQAHKIYAYLEIDSINQELLTQFMKNNNIDTSKMVYIDKDQREIQELQNNREKNILIVTYNPYDIILREKGFQEIASTKDVNTLIVIDALCATNKTIKTDKKRVISLKKIIDKAIESIQKDPKASYLLVRKHLENISYSEYINSLQLIKWINKPSKKLLKQIEKYGYNKENIIQ